MQNYKLFDRSKNIRLLYVTELYNGKTGDRNGKDYTKNTETGISFDWVDITIDNNDSDDKRIT